MRNIELPHQLSSSISNEQIDFSVKARRAQPLKKSSSLIFFGTIWTALTSIFVFAFFSPLFQGNEVHFEANGVPTVAGPDNLEPIIMPAILLGIFVLVGVGMLYWGIYSTFKKGGFFVGTPIRLVHFHNGNIRSIDWELFSGDIEVSGNDQKGSILLQMRTGAMVSRKNGPDSYVPNTIYISDIPNVYEVEQICRRRIKENDPTPPLTLNSMG